MCLGLRRGRRRVEERVEIAVEWILIGWLEIAGGRTVVGSMENTMERIAAETMGVHKRGTAFKVEAVDCRFVPWLYTAD